MAREFETASGMTLVDAYWVPNSEAGQYIADREALAEVATEFLKPFCASVERCWKGSEDGEAIVGMNSVGEIISLIHLDPDGVALLRKPEQLKAYLQVR